MRTINDIKETMIIEYVIIEEFNKARYETKRTTWFIQRMIQLCAYDIMLMSLSLIENSGLIDNYPEKNIKHDDIRLDRSKLTKEATNMLIAFYKSYKKYRNKTIAHATTNDDETKLDIQALKIVIDIIVCYVDHNGQNASVNYATSGIITKYMSQMLRDLAKLEESGD